MLCALAELFDRNPEEFKTTPARAAVVFWGLLFANAHSLMEDGDKLDAAAMVDIVLHGIASRDSESVV
jgi:hypothetical protein